MTGTGDGELQNVSMLDLFRIEVEDKAAMVSNGLLALSVNNTTKKTSHSFMLTIREMHCLS